MAGGDSWRAALRTYYCIKFSLSFYSTLFSVPEDAINNPRQNRDYPDDDYPNMRRPRLLIKNPQEDIRKKNTARRNPKTYRKKDQPLKLSVVNDRKKANRRSRAQNIIGLLILCIGIYAESERRKHQTLEGIFLAPAIILLLLGILMFVVSFIGMVGSLRDNLRLLKIFFWVLLVIFLVEVLLIAIELVCETEMKKFAHANILVGLKHYYDDLDFKNIMDFVQEKFSCCGGDQFTDWMVNPYHSCNSTGPLSCGVPYTCCITGTGSGGVKNTLCGYQTLDKERLEVMNIIHVRGCIHAVGLWLNDNFGITFGLVLAVLGPQALGIGLSYLFWTKLKDICYAYDETDFRLLQIKDFNFKELDLSGAGCCLCLPREGGYIPVNMDSDDEKAS